MARVKKSDSKELMTMADVEKQMVMLATNDSAREKAANTGSTISTRGQKFSYQGETIGDEMSVIVLDFGHENAFYTSSFDPDDPQPPACFALSMDGEDMAPHESAPEPQAASCSECPNNEWGSAEKGKGKACKNRRRLVCVENSDDINSAELALLSLAPTSIKNWKGHVSKIRKQHNRPPLGVLTKFSFDDEEDKVIVAEIEEVIDDPRKLIALMTRRPEAEEIILHPYDTSNYDPDHKPAGKRGRGNKAKEAPTKNGAGKKGAPKKGNSRFS